MTDTGRRTGPPDGTCRHCRADLIWVWLTGGHRGRRVPLDPEQRPADDEAARYAVTRDHLDRLRGRLLEDGERPAPWERRGVSHLDTCPVLRARREAADSLRQAKAAAPDHTDPEALREARQEQTA